MAKGYRIEQFEDADIYCSRMKNFDEKTIECTKHTLFRLSEKQRKIFTCEEIKKFLLHENPLAVAIQYNGNYAVYYKYKEQKLIKVIISIRATFIRIIMFMIVEKEQMPKG